MEVTTGYGLQLAEKETYRWNLIAPTNPNEDDREEGRKKEVRNTEYICNSDIVSLYNDETSVNILYMYTHMYK